MKKAILKSMTIGEIFQKHPDKTQELNELMAHAGLHCIGCGAASFETLEEGMLTHQMSKKAMTSLVNSINNIINNKVKNITFTDFAARKCKNFRKKPTHMFKVNLITEENKRKYIFKFKKEKSDNEIEFKDKGVTILIDKKDINKLSGVVIDYIEERERGYFKIKY